MSRPLDRIVAAIDELDVRAVAPALRSELATAWAEAGLEAHASIAAFSRFSLELLALGAPPDLVAGAHEAALDAIEHARASFAVATRLSGSPSGPGPLAPEAFDLARVDVATLVTAATRDGCIGETASAVIAGAERDACTIAPLRELLAVIAEAEARHACLAWRFVAWAIAKYGDSARRGFADGLGSPSAVIAVTSDPPTATFGRLGADRRRAIAATVHAEVVAASAALLADPERALAILVGTAR